MWLVSYGQIAGFRHITKFDETGRQVLVIFVTVAIFCIGSSMYWSVDNINFRTVIICVGEAIIAHTALFINVGIRLYYVLTKKQLPHLQAVKETPNAYIAEIYQQIINHMHMIIHSPSQNASPSANNNINNYDNVANSNNTANNINNVNKTTKHKTNTNNSNKVDNNNNNNDNNFKNKNNNENGDENDGYQENSHSDEKKLGPDMHTQLQLYGSVSSYRVTATKEPSAWNKQKTYIISNCLIAVLGIGKYQG